MCLLIHSNTVRNQIKWNIDDVNYDKMSDRAVKTVKECTQLSKRASNKTATMTKYVPKHAYYSVTYTKVCTFSSQKEYILLGHSISRRIGTQHLFFSARCKQWLQVTLYFSFFFLVFTTWLLLLNVERFKQKIIISITKLKCKRLQVTSRVEAQVSESASTMLRPNSHTICPK